MLPCKPGDGKNLLQVKMRFEVFGEPVKFLLEGQLQWCGLAHQAFLLPEGIEQNPTQLGIVKQAVQVTPPDLAVGRNRTVDMIDRLTGAADQAEQRLGQWTAVRLSHVNFVTGQLAGFDQTGLQAAWQRFGRNPVRRLLRPHRGADVEQPEAIRLLAARLDHLRVGQLAAQHLETAADADDPLAFGMEAVDRFGKPAFAKPS